MRRPLAPKTCPPPRAKAPGQGSERLSIGVLLYAYAVLLGAAYLFAFWRPFGFSVFPYLSPQDYITLPFNRVVVLAAVPLLSLPMVLQGMRINNSTFKSVAAGLQVGYTFAAAWFFVGSVRLYLEHGFHYRNEITVLLAAAILAFTSCGVVQATRQSPKTAHSLMLAIVLLQCSTVLLAGYQDGKTIYNGAAEIHFLDSSDACEKSEKPLQWVFLSRTSELSIFMHKFDKRLCFTGEKSYRLTSRMVVEKL